MSMHLIIGKGNVGVDLFHAIKSRGEFAKILTRSDGFDLPESLPLILQMKPDYVWVTAGAGSVEVAKKNYKAVLETHVMLPKMLMEELEPSVKICLFSSDYAAHENEPSNPLLMSSQPRSFYALSKIHMEQVVALGNRPRTAIVRIGSVYGPHFYNKTLPGKLHQRYPSPCTLTLPMNRVTPTPSFWIAEMLLKNRDKLVGDKPVTHHLAPMGGTSINGWGQRILGEDYKVNSSGFDIERPLCSNLGCSIGPAPDWTELWSSNWTHRHPPMDTPLDV